MRFCFFIFLLLFFLPLTGTEVEADRLNIRVRPDRLSPVIAILPQGTKVKVLSESGDWSKLEIPNRANVWVNRVYVTHNFLCREGAVFRSGPGSAHSAYHGVVKAGTPIKKVSAFKNGEWFRVEPPAGLFAYAVSSYLKKNSGQNLNERDFVVSYIDGVEFPSAVEGCLIKMKRRMFNAQYSLEMKLNGNSYPICYVTTDNLNISLWENCNVQIVGKRCWVHGVAIPFFKAEKISPDWN